VARVIKKYGNRRLYDTEASQYVNLTDVARMVRQGQNVEVQDAKTGEDLTRQVLTQIIVEDSRRTEGGAPIEFLQNMIRASDRAQHDFFQWYLSTAAQAYERIQQTWRKQASWPPAAPQWRDWLRLWDPLHALEHLAPRPPARSAPQRQEGDDPEPGRENDHPPNAGDDSSMSSPRATTPGNTSATERTADGTRDDEIDELKRRLEQLEERLNR
jgi:polyhydroxyalkanoate synthesis repressor PhaR